MSSYPEAIAPEKVGEYEALAKSGGGYFFDEVLEYRVWCHPERGATDEYEGEDYFYAFAGFDEARLFSQQTPGAEDPLVLIRQYEWVDEPETGQLLHCRGERMTEWRCEWLSSGARQPGQIEAFIAAGGDD